MPRPLGQHFLAPQSILERIAKAACPEIEPLVVEIGAGRGALTGHLLERAKRLIAIEVDPALAEELGRKFQGEERLEIVIGDVLRLDLDQWGPAVITGNLPYYITSPILAKVLALGDAAKRAVLLVQQEVAERLTAPPGCRAYGLLTVQVALFGTARLLFRVPASAFRPPPKVDSAVVELIRCNRAGELGIRDADAFLRFAARCFRQKRKTLRNNLAGAYPAWRLDGLPEAGLRAEQLSLGQLAHLYQLLCGSDKAA